MCLDKHSHKLIDGSLLDILRQQRIDELEEVIAYRDEVAVKEGQQLADQEGTAVAGSSVDKTSSVEIKPETKQTDVVDASVMKPEAAGVSADRVAPEEEPKDKPLEKTQNIKELVDEVHNGSEVKATVKPNTEKEESAEVRGAMPPSHSMKKIPRLRGTALQLSKYIRAVAAHKYAYLFKEPFDEDDYPDYYSKSDRSKESMTLTALRSEVEDGKIENAQEVYNRMMFMFDKAIQYFSDEKGDDEKDKPKGEDKDTEEEEEEDDNVIEARELKHYAKQVADEFQFLRTAEAMESSKPTTRRRHASSAPTDDTRGKVATESVTIYFVAVTL